MYPSIGDYLDALNAQSDGLWRSIAPLRPTFDDSGDAIYSSGNFGVVFRTTDRSGGLHALKCFTRPAMDRAQAYDRLARELPRGVDHLVSHRYLRGELTVWHHGAFEPFDVLDMEWVEGPTLLVAITQAAERGDQEALGRLFDSFIDLARWLVGSGLAHGDLKPENIIVARSGVLRLVDYDAMYLPSMAGEAQREVGTPAWQHVERGAMAFSPSIDHYPIALLAATLDALRQLPELLGQFSPPLGGLLFDPEALVLGVDPAAERLAQYGLCGAWLDLLGSSDGVLAGLADRLVGAAGGPAEAPWVPFEHAGRWGFTRAGTRDQIAPIFDRVLPFSEGLAAACINDRWGFIDQRGEPVGRFAFDNAWNFCGGLALVVRRGKYGYVDRSAQTAIAARYDRARNFSEGYAVVAIGGRYGLIDQKGRTILALEWDHLSNVHHQKTIGERDGEKIELSIQ